MSVAACSTTDHMPREEALQMLEESCTGMMGAVAGSQDGMQAAIHPSSSTGVSLPLL